MDKIKMGKELFIKKLEPDNEKDLSLLTELNKDEMVTGKMDIYGLFILILFFVI